MLKEINDLLSKMTFTLIGGAFLIFSFILQKIEFNVLIDPSWITVTISGIPLLYLSIQRIINNKGISKISSALLITIAMIAAISIGDLFAAGEVAFIMAIGALLEEMTTNRAKKGLQKLINLTPVQGRKITNGNEYIVLANEIKQGDILRVLPGETIPVDGVIKCGETSVDQSIMTGESLPVDKEIGDHVFCGTINRFGSIDIQATKVGEDCSLQKLIKMVHDAENNQAPTQSIADKCASWLVPVALLISILTLIFTMDIIRAVTVLVVFCPCALVLATPTSIMAAIGQATKHGVIIKSGDALEKMGKINTIAFDKTGTLTFGKLDVCNIISCSKFYDSNTLLTLVASVEAKSEHPLGKAITQHAKTKGATIFECSDFKMYAGKGITATINQQKIYCGNEKFLNENSINLDNKIIQTLDQLRTDGKASIIIATQTMCIGIIALADVIRPNGTKMVKKLNKMHTKTILLTGDNQKTANYFARKIGITEVQADLLPEDKVKHIQELRSENNVICMIGDGVNDAPALKLADVGIAMGSMGSDIAIEAADIALMSDDISKIPYLKRLSNATVNTIKFAITLSMTINFIAIILSVNGILTPTTGALVHNGGSCLVVLIAALLYDRKFD